MALQNFFGVKGTCLAIGPVYDQLERISNIDELILDYSLVVFNGNLLFPYDDILKIKERISKINKLLEKNVVYSLGGYDLKLYSILSENNLENDIQKWINNKPSVISINFINGSKYILIGGGICNSSMTEQLLGNDIESSFMSYRDNKPWHEFYSGQLGYVISNNPLTCNEPIKYNFSTQIGNKYSSSFKIYAQEFNQFGLGKTLSF